MVRSTAFVLIIGALLLAGCDRGGAPESEPDRASAPIPDTIRSELIRMGADDQAARQGLTPERAQDTAFLRTMLRDDSARSQRLRAIVDRYGWPEPTAAGEEAAGAAFLVLQHSPDHEFQRDMLPTLEALAHAGAMPRPSVAMLTDRVLIHDGEPQRYGTQFDMEDGRLVLHPVEDEAGLDERRREMMLPPLAEYIRLMEAMYQTEIDAGARAPEQ